jgi:hypothetical protein
VVWWARRELREVEEQCCDAWVVWASGGDGHAYARALLEAVAFVSRTRCPLPAAASGIGQVYHLRRRLTMIVRGSTPRSLSALGWIVVLTLGLCLLPVAARAQAPTDKGDDRDRAIKALKEQLRALEDQARSDKEQVRRAAVIALGKLAVDEDKITSDDKDMKEAVAELKKQIAAKRAELRALEAKLEQIVAGMEGKKAGKAKAGAVKLKLKELKDIEIDEKAAKQFDEAIQKDMKALQEHLKQVPKGAIVLEGLDPKAVKQLAEKIQKALADDPNLKQFKELKELKNLKGLNELDFKKLEELKKLGAIQLDLKSHGELKKQLEEFKKAVDVKELDRAKALKAEAEARAKAKPGKTEDIDARLDRLMKEIQELRREIHQGKDKSVK